MSKTVWPGWKTIGMIGRGGFGEVYEVERDVAGLEKAAVKRISIPQDSGEIEELYASGCDDVSLQKHFNDYLQEFLKEYRLMADLKGNTNIVSCDDVRYEQHDDGIGWDIYIRMELLIPLMKVLDHIDTEEQVIKVGRDICNALVLCRSRNIVHRDIKPQNIFVSKNGDYKLGDFGIAKTMEKTSGATKIGTYEYMAPEVYHGQPYGSAADIYSLGMVLYWLLNERRGPFNVLPPRIPTAEEKESARIRRFSGEQIPEPVHGSEELKRIVLKACSFDPKNRFASANEMREELGRLLINNQNELSDRSSSERIILDQTEDEKRSPKTIGIKTTSTEQGADETDRIIPSLKVKTQISSRRIEEAITKTQQLTEQKTDISKEITEKEKKPGKNINSFLMIALGAIVLVVLVAIVIILRECNNDDKTGMDYTAERTSIPISETVSDEMITEKTSAEDIDSDDQNSQLQKTEKPAETPVSTEEPTNTPIPTEEPTVTPTATQKITLPDDFIFGGQRIVPGQSSVEITGKKKDIIHISQDELNQLVLYCPNLKRLSLDFCYMTDYSRIGELSSLRELEIMTTGNDNGGVKMSDIDWITSLKGLKKLFLCHNAISDISALEELTELEELNLADNRIENSDLKYLRGLKKLKELYLYLNKDLSNVDVLSSLESLQLLHLGGCRKISDISALTGLSNLKELKIGFDDNITFEYFKDFKGLEIIWLQGCNANRDYSKLSSCKKLKTIYIYTTDTSLKTVLEKTLPKIRIIQED